MNLNHPTADIYVPDGSDIGDALKRGTSLAIGAHQDDLEIMAYPAIAESYEDDSKWFCGVVATSGSGSSRTGPYADVSDEEMVNIRRKEQRDAADIGKFSCVIQLGYGSAEVKAPSSPGVVEDLSAIIEACGADTLYLHNPADKHDSHVALLQCCVAAVRKVPADKRPSRMLGCEVWRDLDWLPDELKTLQPTDAYPELARKLLEIFDSQVTGGKRYDLAVLGRRLANATFYQSHESDGAEGLAASMDLSPLLKDDSLDLATFTLQMIDAFKQDVETRLLQFQQ